MRAVSGPLIPYIDAPELPLPFLRDMWEGASIKPFGTLVALGVYLGSIITMRRSREREIAPKTMSDFIFWVVAPGFVISHILDAIFYHPDQVMRDPLYLLKIWDGLSSYGGLIGAVIGMFAWGFLRRQRVLEYCDITVSAFPTAWVFGRAGCASVHDHPGAPSNAWYAVNCAGEQMHAFCSLPAGFDGRIDLGLVEFALTIPLAAACHYLWHTKPLRPNGFYVGLTLTCYAPVRFLLDFLRVDSSEHVVGSDPRYGGLTPAQWACFLALAVGLYFLKRTVGKPYVRYAAVERLADDEDDDSEPTRKPVAEARTKGGSKGKKRKKVRKPKAEPTSS